MDQGTLVVIGVIALVVVVILLLIRAAGSRQRMPRLRPLAAESRERYIGEWDDLEAKFVDAPEQTVREAESLVMSMLRERGHPLTERELPREMQQAHRLGYSSRGGRTEGLAEAPPQYRSLMERMIGSTEDVRRDQRRREMA